MIFEKSMSNKKSDNYPENDIICIIGTHGIDITNLLNLLTNEENGEFIYGLGTYPYKLQNKEFTLNIVIDDKELYYANYYKDEILNSNLIVLMVSLEDIDSLDYAKKFLSLILDETNKKISKIIILGDDENINLSLILKKDMEEYIKKKEHCIYIPSYKKEENLSKLKKLFLELTGNNNEKVDIKENKDSKSIFYKFGTTNYCSIF